ncbi:MAG: DNA glycosylase AlkZ-like family protein [Bryobacteraceae bacterium]
MSRFKTSISALRRHAVANSLFRPTTLKRAIERLGFVQADPIRSPARAQDLILRHRVKNYRAGDLETKYPRLGIEEDFLYAYGFMPQSTWRLLHPRVDIRLTSAEQRVFELVSDKDHLHPRELEEHLGRAREVNAWGGYSKATTRILHSLHYRGLLRVSGRANGIRTYEAIPSKTCADTEVDPRDRLKRLIVLITNILAPVPERSLRAALQHLAHAAPALEGRHSTLTALIESGDLANAEVEGIRYLWPAGPLVRKPAARLVRVLAPFDPLVWDRRRFQHFWGWEYRFEAYTPVAKRKRGYYAMPLLWGEDIIGWVNIASRAENGLEIETGFPLSKPSEKAFREEFQAEMERISRFLRVGAESHGKQVNEHHSRFGKGRPLPLTILNARPNTKPRPTAMRS